MTQDSKNCSTDSGENSATQTPQPSLSKDERRKLAQKNWREKNPNYWKEWRAKNPGYQSGRRKATADGTWPHRNTPAAPDAAPCTSEPPSVSYGPNDAPGT